MAPSSSSQLAPSSLSQSPTSPPIASSFCSIRTCFSTPQKTPNSKANVIERSDAPISNALMRSWFQEIFTSLIRIEDTQQTLIDMVGGVGGINKSTVCASPAVFKFSTTADELDSNLNRLSEFKDCERESLIKFLSNVTIASDHLSGNLARMLLVLAPSSVWALYSRDGKRGKRSVNPNFVSIIIDTLMQKSQKAINVKKVAEALTTQLKRMPMHSKRVAVKAENRLKGIPSRAPKKKCAPEPAHTSDDDVSDD